MTKATILTGLRANNDLHIGNYFGAMLPMIDMAKQKSADYQINMFIPDLHSFTTPIDHSQLYDQILHNARLFAAAGLPLDNNNIHLYRQSYIAAHSELTWILDCFTNVGTLSRMTQFKEKAREKSAGLVRTLDHVLESVDQDILNKLESSSLTKLQRDAVEEIKIDLNSLKLELIESTIFKEGGVGLFNYPVLMSADILLYGAQYIPVGDDQTQHLEFARDIAIRINNRFGDIFTVPEPVVKQHEFFGKDQGLRIKDLVDPTKKMSKSDDTGKGVIFLGDNPEAAAKKIMAATTDDKAYVRFDRTNQPGITNLLEILALLRSGDLRQTIGEFEGQTRYGDFKKVVADEMRQFLVAFQTRLASVDDNVILAKLQQSEQDMSVIANQTLLRAQQAVGLRPRGK
jgi:tryptophanyl-tRNA synthetase